MRHPFEERIERFVRTNQLLNAQDTYLVALSGGADSVSLLTALLRLGYHVDAVHCHFHLRGDEADRDERFCMALCEKRNVRLHRAHFDTITYAQLHKQSIETAARELRYHYFEQLINDTDAQGVCVAHHQQDVAETVLMNLCRGTGLQGMSGIRARNGHVIRPLLCVSRQQILDYLADMRQDYVTDSTNTTPCATRNKVRLQAMPVLKSIYRQADTNMANTARHIAAALPFIQKAVDDARRRVMTDENSISIQALQQETGMQFLLFELLSPLGFRPKQTEEIVAALDTDSTGKTWKSGTHVAVIDRDRILLSGIAPDFTPRKFPEEGKYCFPDVCMEILRQPATAGWERDRHTACLDAAKVAFPLTLRRAATADRFCPLGMKGSKLLSDYMTDHKFPRTAKERQLVVEDAHGHIVWLVGERIDERAKITDKTINMIKIIIT